MHFKQIRSLQILSHIIIIRNAVDLRPMVLDDVQNMQEICSVEHEAVQKQPSSF